MSHHESMPMPEWHSGEDGGVSGGKWKLMCITGVRVLKQAPQTTLCKQQQDGSDEI